jgi:aryl carrier-like protein
LPEPVLTTAAGLPAEQLPRTPAERALAAIWAEVLGRESIGVDENFFEAGGDSIIGMQIAARARAAGLALSVRDVQRHPTVAAQAAIVAAAGGIAEAAAHDDRPLLLPAQRWFFAQEQPDAHHHNMAMLLEIAAGTSPALLERALQAVTALHPALRTGFRDGDGGWKPFVVTVAHVALQRHDVRDCSPELEAREIESVSTRVQTSLVLDEPPLLRAVLFERGEGRTAKLLLALHHLVVDGVSLRVILDDVQRVYRQLAAGGDVAAHHPSTTPQAYAAALEASEREDAFASDGAFRSELRGDVVVPLEPSGTSAENLVGTEGHRAVQLDRDETAVLLAEAARAHSARPDDLVLGAVVEALGAWLGNGSILIDVEMHGRDSAFPGVDLAQSVGWFTTIAPVELELNAGRSTAATVVHARSARGGIAGDGDGSFARGLAPRAEILFNYLGVFRPGVRDGFVVSIAREVVAGERSPHNRRTHLLEINAFVVDDRLEVDVAFSRALLGERTIEAFTANLAAALRAVSRAVPIPDTDLDGDRLERVLSSLGAD